MTDPISYHRRDDLREHFRANIKPPWWTRKWRVVDAAPQSVTLSLGKVPVKVGGLDRLVRAITDGLRRDFAAYHWLHPYDRPYEVAHLEGLLASAGLDHLERRGVITTLINDCDEIGRKHPRLDRWVRARVERLKVRLAPPANQDARDSMLARRLLHAAAALMAVDAESAGELAARAVDQALVGAAQAVHAELGDGAGGDLHASLMIPVKDHERVLGYLAALGMATVAASDRAKHLWEDVASRAHKHLMIVAETRKAHAGFWAPIVDGEGGTTLAGAPTAYRNHLGSLVLFNDPPPLLGFSESLNHRWRAYLRDHVAGQLFVSLPLLAPRAPGEPQTVLAVVNVNGYPEQGREWLRGYSPEWLERARDAASPWLECAFYAWQYHAMAVAAQLNVSAGCDLDAESADWNMLTGEQNGAPLALEDGGESD